MISRWPANHKDRFTFAAIKVALRFFQVQLHENSDADWHITFEKFPENLCRFQIAVEDADKMIDEAKKMLRRR